MATGQWNPRIDKGAVWRRTLRYRDAAGSPIPVQGPGYMDLRAKPDDDAPLVARFDSSGNAEGLITFTGPGAVTLTMFDEETAILPVGRFYFDLFVSDSSGEYIKLCYGVVTVAASVSVAGDLVDAS